MENNNKEEFDLDKELTHVRALRIARDREHQKEIDERLRQCKLKKIKQRGIALGLAVATMAIAGWADYSRRHVNVDPIVPAPTEPDGKIILTEVKYAELFDTLSGYSRQSGTSISEIQQDNDIKNPNEIYIGQRIFVNYKINPEDLEYYTEEIAYNGEDLSTIAAEYNTTNGTLITLNDGVIGGPTIEVPNFISPAKLEELKSARQR